MKKLNIFFVCLSILATISTGCTVTTSGSMNTGNAPPAAKASPVTSAPTGAKTIPAAKIVPVPENWITMEDGQKGYSFEVPEGTQHHNEHSNGVDVFIAGLPKPSEVGVLVMAFKDPKLTKDDLVKVATSTMEEIGAKNVKITGLSELSADYSLGTYTAQNADGKSIKGKVLVATDVTDNYVMLVGTEEPQYQANEKIIDQVWGSFSMHSGGASGKS